MQAPSKVSAEGKLYRWLFFLAGIAGFAALIFVTISRGPGLWKDEVWYLKNVPLLEQYGLSREFLIKYWGPAGPLYALVHYCLKPFTHLELPGVRLVNIGMLAGTMMFSALSLKLQKADPLKAVAYLAIPMIFVCAGMSLTEIPAMFFLSLAVLLLQYGYAKQNNGGKAIYGLISGLCLALAILGRQPYLVVVIASLIFLLPHVLKKNTLLIGCFLAGTLIPTLFVFSVWGNIQPPVEARTGIGISPFHGFLALGYGAFVVLLIAPSWFYKPSKKYIFWLAALYILIILVNLFAIRFQFLPMRSVLQRLLGNQLQEICGMLFSSTIVFVGAYFLISAAVRFFGSLKNPGLCFYIASCVLILLTSAKVTHQFSSRYVAQAAPFFILMLAPYTKFNAFKVCITVAGIVLGLMSLNSFLT